MWIDSRRFDLPFIILPAFISSFVVFIAGFLGLLPNQVSPMMWLILVVFIDVSHVWSTVFRTYLNREKRKDFNALLWIIPLVAYIVGVLLHSIHPMVFWTPLAYLATFHFIRQQYGFFMIYRGKEKNQTSHRLFDKVAIYSTTLFPLILWHSKGMQDFHWFVEGDFFYFPSLKSTLLYKLIYATGIFIPLAYLFKEFFLLKKPLMTPKTLILVGTFLSWWAGIVWFASDFSFTFTNIVSHGIPYFALIFVSDMKDKRIWSFSRKIPVLLLFIPLFLIGFIEEGLWDALIWQDNNSLFAPFYFLPAIENVSLKALLVPLLALPQATHYLLDGLIWKNGEK